ncbi:MAG: RNA 2',3'-cyclic phosphodiesterase [Lentisphaeraceae bacterium]|nr:RNA 2',3'-cyclic phosphodiesterase [Lentisphaeraceae bacterium]
MDKYRCFIALPLESKISRLLHSQLKADDKLKIVTRENLHVSLIFLGSITEEEVAEVKMFMDAVKGASFNVDFKEVAFFPNDHSRYLIAATFQGNEQLIDIHRFLHEKISALGIELDKREFKPHVTLARVKKNRRATFSHMDFKEKMTANAISLFTSDLRSEGPVYSEIHRVELP